MWRMLNNLTRAFRTHVYNPRPSAGVLVEDDQEHDQATQGHCDFSDHKNSKDLNSHSGEQWDCWENSDRQRGHKSKVNGGDSNERQNTFHHDFWHLLHGSHNMFQAVTWGPVFMWGSDRGNWKQKTSSGLLYNILFALPGRFSPATVRSILPPIREERLDQSQPQRKQLAIKDAEGAAIDQKINSSKTETLEVALKEFQKVCHEYSACSESLLGLQAANGGDMPNAVEHLQRSCLLGNMSACFNLGLCYETGSGVPKDETKATYFYQKAAKGGHKMALYNLGLMCLRHGKEENQGPCVEGGAKGKTGKKGGGNFGLNKEMGLDFLEEAARLGLPEAQTYFGLYLMDECHQPAQAVFYFKAAADQNDSEAQYLLALCYEQGLGVERNECLAARFYSRAAQTGHDLALYNLGVFNEEGLGGLPQNKATAVEMYQKAAKLGSVEAQERLGEILGPGVSDSTTKRVIPDHDDAENKDRNKFTHVAHGQPEEQGVTENKETCLAYDSAAVENPFFSLLSPSSSFPSLHSLSSYSIPRRHVAPPRVSSSLNSDMKLMMHGSSDSLKVETDKTEGFLGKVGFFLDIAPTAMTLDHDIDSPFGSLSKNFSSRSIPLSSLGAGEEGADCLVPMHRSHTLSDFSMIGI